MIKNTSDSEKTIKSTIASCKSDIWSYDRTAYYVNYANLSVLPIGSILDSYSDYFDNYLDTIKLDEKYRYAPARFAADYYGAPGLDFLVMYFAKIPSMFDFDKEYITVLKPDRLKDFSDLMLKYKKEVKESHDSPDDYEPFDEISSTTKAYTSTDSAQMIGI